MTNLVLAVSYGTALFIAIGVYLRAFGKSNIMRGASGTTLWIGSLLVVIALIPAALLALKDGIPLTVMLSGIVLGALIGIPISFLITLIDRVPSVSFALPSKPGRPRPAKDDVTINVNGRPVTDNTFAFSAEKLSTAPPKGGFKK